MINIPYQIGQRIKFKIAEDIEAIITAIIIRPGDFVSFECSYIQGAQHKVCTVTMEEIEHVGKKKTTTIGFGKCTCGRN